ncbi:putative gustatory receptor 2a [Schistocerca americana]|uniref:putative gustatory receptor 2a n=1 Tax=Schistocerca americana TaxID=7009 RepID=UPI001F4F2FDA|nr:putative gustatory receptor 2a [Schistocerca americana]
MDPNRADTLRKQQTENAKRQTDHTKLPGEAEEVRRLRQVHDHVCDVAKLIDDGYGLSMLSCLATHFINCIISLNLCLSIKLQYQVFTRDKMDSMVYVSVMWVVVHVGGILAITWSCSKASSEIRRTADLVNKVLLSPMDYGTTGASVRRQLKLFSLQLLHRRLRFTASGLFTIDLSNLSSMATGVVTYLVIFVQFNDTEKSAQACNSN